MPTVDRDEAVSKSTQTFTTALILNAAIALGELAVFLLIRSRFNQIYQPRTIFPLPSKRTSPIPSGLFSFFPALVKTPAHSIIYKNGLDGYMFVRYLFMMSVKIFAPIWFVSWAVLLPTDAVRSGGTGKGLDMFTFGNIGPSPTQQTRYAAHCLLAWIFTFYIFYVIRVELSRYVMKRQEFLISATHASRPQSRTVLVQGVPPSYLRKSKIVSLCNTLPGGVERIWWVRDLSVKKEGPLDGSVDESGKPRKKTSIQDDYNRRLKLSNKLESAETKLIKTAVKNSKKKSTASAVKDMEKGSSAARAWVDDKKRPTMKLGLLGLVGKKVDAIDYCRAEIARLNNVLEYKRERLDAKVVGGDKWEFPREGGVFILFRNQTAAHLFAQALVHSTPLYMSQKYLNVAREDVIWGNLSINPYQQRIRTVISWGITLGIIIFWSFPVAFVGLISNVTYLCSKAHWLAWLCTLPVPVNGIIQGVLPPVALSVLFMLLPIVLRLLAKFEGMPLNSLVELSLMRRYFVFLVIQGFLVVTLSSGLVAALPQIADNPSSTVSILAENLPKASTFFLTYIVTTGLAGAGGALLQIATLFIYYIKIYILGSTPRSVYEIKYKMGDVKWGTLFPGMSLLTVISLSYMIISPIINGLACVSFGVLYAVYKYLFLWVLDMPPAGETGGLFFPVAISHVFVGLYIGEVCLTGLFFLARDANNKVSALGEAIVMVVLIFVTIFYQYLIKQGFSPLYEYLPLTQYQEEPKSSSELLNGLDLEEEGRVDPTKVNDTGSAYRGPSVEKDRILGEPNGQQYPPSSNSLVAKEKMNQSHAMTGEEPHAFDHPASYEAQRTIWIPRDSLGLGIEEVRDTKQANVAASDEGATMNAKGQVDISRSPPDEPWEETMK